MIKGFDHGALNNRFLSQHIKHKSVNKQNSRRLSCGKHPGNAEKITRGAYCCCPAVSKRLDRKIYNKMCCRFQEDI